MGRLGGCSLMARSLEVPLPVIIISLVISLVDCCKKSQDEMSNKHFQGQTQEMKEMKETKEMKQNFIGTKLSLVIGACRSLSARQYNLRKYRNRARTTSPVFFLIC